MSTGRAVQASVSLHSTLERLHSPTSCLAAGRPAGTVLGRVVSTQLYVANQLNPRDSALSHQLLPALQVSPLGIVLGHGADAEETWRGPLLERLAAHFARQVRLCCCCGAVLLCFTRCLFRCLRGQLSDDLRATLHLTCAQLYLLTSALADTCICFPPMGLPLFHPACRVTW